MLLHLTVGLFQHRLVRGQFIFVIGLAHVLLLLVAFHDYEGTISPAYVVVISYHGR